MGTTKDSRLHIETQTALMGPEDSALAKKNAKQLHRHQRNQEIRDRKLYTLGGEIFSSITHGITAAAGIAALILGVVFAAKNPDMGALAIVGIIIFGACAFLGFTISTVYHGLRISTGKRVMRVLDHCSIYSLIAGTYTAFCFIVLPNWVGFTIFGVNWTLAIVGTTLTAINRKKFKHFAFTCYLVMGWMVIFFIVPFIREIGFGTSWWLLLSGGIAYTLGAVVYKLKGKYIHGVWHLFTLAGLALHFLSILFLVL